MAGYNANIAFPQGGNTVELGGYDGRPTTFDREHLRFALAGGPDYVALFDDFLGDTIRAEWVNDIDSGGSITLAGTVQSGVAVVANDTTDDDNVTLSAGLHWLVSRGSDATSWTWFTARVAQVTNITTRAVEIGVSDAVSETAGLAFSSHDTPTAVATNAAVFAIDSDESLATWNINTVNAGGTPTQTTLTTAPTAGTYQEFTIAIDGSGNAYFYIDGTLEATVSEAVATTALLTPWVTLKNLSGAIHSMNVDFVGMVGPR